MARTAAWMHGHFSCELCSMHQSSYEIGPTSDGRADEDENHHEELQLIEKFPLLYLVLTLWGRPLKTYHPAACCRSFAIQL